MRCFSPLFTVSLAALCVCLVSADSAHAQEADLPHALEEGAWALQFGVGENVTLSSLLGATLSIKRHVADDRAWQVGVTLDADVNILERKRSGNASSSDREIVAVTARYLTYPLLKNRPDDALQLFAGAGPTLRFDRSSQTNDQNEQSNTNTTTTWGAGVSGVLGAEWFVTPRISISGAYETSLLYSRESRDLAAGDDLTETVITLNARGARLSVSAYF